jgi:hypothetical protein
MNSEKEQVSPDAESVQSFMVGRTSSSRDYHDESNGADTRLWTTSDSSPHHGTHVDAVEGPPMLARRSSSQQLAEEDEKRVFEGEERAEENNDETREEPQRRRRRVRKSIRQKKPLPVVVAADVIREEPEIDLTQLPIVSDVVAEKVIQSCSHSTRHSCFLD